MMMIDGMGSEKSGYNLLKMVPAKLGFQIYSVPLPEGNFTLTH